jgi:hypothetical protein
MLKRYVQRVVPQGGRSINPSSTTMDFTKSILNSKHNLGASGNIKAKAKELRKNLIWSDWL